MYQGYVNHLALILHVGSATPPCPGTLVVHTGQTYNIITMYLLHITMDVDFGDGVVVQGQNVYEGNNFHTTT